MSKEDLDKWAIEHGWTRDRFGHYHKGEYRIKVQAYSIRIEKSYTIPASQYSRAEKRWLKVKSGYLKNVSVSAEGKLQIS